MILLGLATALAEPALEERLLGPAPTAVSASVAPSAGFGGVGGLLGLCAVGAGLYAWRRERRPAPEGADLSVVARHPTPGGTLLLVDVRGMDGGSHRLLVGSGSGGVQLLADVTIGLDLSDGEAP